MRARLKSLPAVLFCALVATLVPASDAVAANPAPLRILVTNDDGWIGANGSSTPLIVALRDALAAAGHNVTVVAPATDQSGHGTQLTFGPPLTLLSPEPHVWTVTGTPADSVLLGMDVLFGMEKPDLVVSGINPGGNYSSLLAHSGTVGAATTALELGVPAIAVSIDGSTAQSVALKDTVAKYTATLVARLEDRANGGRLLPADIGLNVNYPGTIPAPKGSEVTTQDPNSYIGLAYKKTSTDPGPAGTYQLAPGAPTAKPALGSDWDALTRGDISIQPIDADRTAFGPWQLAALNALGTFAP